MAATTQKTDYTGPAHYFASCALAWATADTEAEAISKAIRHAGIGQRDVARLQREGNPGFYIWTCRVLADSKADYRIEWYMPKGIDIDSATHHSVTHISKADVKVYTHKGEV